MEQTQGELVVFEGIDGCGKTSHSKAAAEYLGAEWRRFPNRDTPFGKLIDTHLRRLWTAVHTNGGSAELGTDSLLTDGMVFQAIQIANRVECAEEFRQTLKQKHIVCDRYWPSGFSYGGADGLDKQYMISVHKGLIQPNVYILFEVEIEEAFRRMKKRESGGERYDNQDFLRKVAANYRELWDLHAGDPCWLRIDANGSQEETWAKVKAALDGCGGLVRR